LGRVIHGLTKGNGAAAALEAAGIRLVTAPSPAALLRGIAEGRPDLVLVSFAVEGVDSPFVERVIEAMGGADRVLLAAPGASLELAVLARRLGTGSLLREPIDGEELRHEVARRAPVRDGVPIPAGRPSSPVELVGSGPAMAEVVRTIAEVGDTPAAVLVTGESGTGKELVARALHWSSARRDGAFVAINCAAVPEHLLESEFFGHERGAFTGAVARKRGRFERADGGTLFLDEVGDMSLVLQAKILRALEEGEVERVGAESVLPVDVRVVAATNRDLEELVSEGTFREDLLFRLAAARIHIPPLRERMDDLDELVLHFAGEFSELYGRPLKGLDRGALRLLHTHSWPGNVRELRNVMDRAVRGCRGAWIRAEDLVLGSGTPRMSAKGPGPDGGLPPTAPLAEVERAHIARVLAYTGGAMGEAAELLGIHRNTLTRKVAQYGLDPGGTHG
jgi:two-component system, NtrC family, response regulator AtoC